MIILASASPRRIEMLKNAGYDPVVKPASINETLPFDMKPETATMYLAMAKAFAVADEITPTSDDGLTVHDPVRFSVNRDWPPSGEDIRIIAADTVVVHDAIVWRLIHIYHSFSHINVPAAFLRGLTVETAHQLGIV